MRPQADRPRTAPQGQIQLGGMTLPIEVNTGLTELIADLTTKIEAATAASRVTNALLLAQRMGLDVTEPVQAQKVMRHLVSVERNVAESSGDAA